MQTFLKKITDAVKDCVRPIAVAGAVAIAGLFISAPPAQAQSIPLKIYFLTNSAPTFTPTNGLFAITNGSLIIGPGGTSNILSAPFQVWRDRGFTLNLAAYVTNSTQTNVINYVMRYGCIHTTNGVTGGGAITNWSQYIAGTFYTSGTTETNYSILVPKTTVDNVSLGQLYSVANQGTNAIYLDPTNAYTGVYP